MTAVDVDFFAAGTPRTQGSMTAIRTKNRAVVVPGNTKTSRDNFHAWRAAVAAEARTHTTRHPDTPWPHHGPVIACLTFGLQRPASAPKNRRTWPCGARSGDVDKLARAVLDAVTGVLIADDAQVVGLSVTKHYGRPGVRVQLWPETGCDQWTPEWHPARTP